MGADEVPPQWMWPHGEELNMWFEEVERQREEKYSGGGSSKAADEVVPLMTNEYADAIRSGKGS